MFSIFFSIQSWHILFLCNWNLSETCNNKTDNFCTLLKCWFSVQFFWLQVTVLSVNVYKCNWDNVISDFSYFSHVLTSTLKRLTLDNWQLSLANRESMNYLSIILCNHFKRKKIILNIYKWRLHLNQCINIFVPPFSVFLSFSFSINWKFIIGVKLMKND